MSPLSTPEVPSARHDGLQQLLGSFDVTTFVHDYLGEQMLHLSGDPSRGAELFSWEDLNALLNRDSWSPPHVRLVRRGQTVKPALYMHEGGGRAALDPVRCQQLMARGATLIVQLSEGISATLDTLMRTLKRELHAEAYADIVVTSAAVPGLNLHWDPYECFNIQLAGWKEWQVIQPARRYPLRHTKYFPQRSDLVEPRVPDGPPTWSGMMQPGDLIYLPRGWWHGVTPRMLPCMHLSIAVDIPTLSDFFLWCAQNVKQHEAARRPIQSWATADARKSSVSDALGLASLISADTLEDFLAHTMNGSRSSVPFSLPASALAAPPVLTQATKLQLQRRPLPHRVVDDLLYLEWGGDTLEFSAGILPLIERLNDNDAIAFAALGEGCNALLVRAFVLSLLSAGVLSIVEDQCAGAV